MGGTSSPTCQRTAILPLRVLNKPKGECKQKDQLRYGRWFTEAGRPGWGPVLLFLASWWCGFQKGVSVLQPRIQKPPPVICIRNAPVDHSTLTPGIKPAYIDMPMYARWEVENTTTQHVHCVRPGWVYAAAVSSIDRIIRLLFKQSGDARASDLTPAVTAVEAPKYLHHRAGSSAAAPPHHGCRPRPTSSDRWRFHCPCARLRRGC